MWEGLCLKGESVRHRIDYIRVVNMDSGLTGCIIQGK